MNLSRNILKIACVAIFISIALPAFSQQKKAYFIDGYHGGVWGHYPDWVTRFMVDMLGKNPDWKLNLEIEPETWDFAKNKDPEAYEDFKKIAADQSAKARVEFVSPAYGQSYMYNISGECIIRHFAYGIKMTRDHFPTATFTTYSSEEPCFTSALPQILKLFGFKYASLKNPNTCWGGYTSAFGGELVNWVGPDGTKLTTVPRYAVESLKPNSTWETVGKNNSVEYITAAFNYGIEHPVGMTIQDAGWKQGPYLGDGTKGYQPTEYKTWTDYIENISIKNPVEDWKFTQEDVLTSLVWGSQVLQRIAQQVRVSENKLASAEKLAAMAKVYQGALWPKASFDQAWTRLLLSQHHDCWIVPYNGKEGDTWADKVVGWTNISDRNADSIIRTSIGKFSSEIDKPATYVNVFNTLAIDRSELASVDLPLATNPVKVYDRNKKEVPSQMISEKGKSKLLFRATNVPSIGYTTFEIQKGNSFKKEKEGAKISKLSNGEYKLETDLYSVLLDPSKGGTIKSLIAKKLQAKEFVDQSNERKFNELRGNFFNDGGFQSSADKPAKISVIENGPLRIKVLIEGDISGNPFAQALTLSQGEKRIDLNVMIDWKGNPGIGNTYAQNAKWESTELRRAFYDDRDKLLTLFPLNLKSQKVYKNAPFDVTESKLKNTFFTTWDSIKNNVILNWVDVTDASNAYGMALLTDHTTNYTHGENHPLGLTTQYSGIGLWGRNYSIKQPTEIAYALIPHQGKWDESGIWTEGTRFNEKLETRLITSTLSAAETSKSMISIKGRGLELSSAVMVGNDLFVRFFNAEGDSSFKEITLDGIVAHAEIVDLNGEKLEDLTIIKKAGKSIVNIAMSRFGIRTIKFSNVNASPANN